MVDQVFDGKAQLTTALQPLVSAAVAVLELDAPRRAHTIVQVDAGGGSRDDQLLAVVYAYDGRAAGLRRA